MIVSRRNIIVYILPILLAIGFQILWMYGVGSRVSSIGWVLYTLQVVIYFLNLFWSVPLNLSEKKFFKFSLKLSIEILAYILLRGLIVYREPWTARFWEILLSKPELLYVSIHLFPILGTSFFTGFYLLNQANARRREQALQSSLDSISEMRRLESVIYQQQLNPHLIFNTLNLIKIEAASLLPNISRAAELLAAIQRIYLINPMLNQMISLEDEGKAISCYVELEGYVKGKNLNVIYSKNFEENKLEIPPGLMLTLVENVFRYGIVLEEEYPATIELILDQNAITLHTNNLKKPTVIKGHGLGQKNVQALLEHYYPGKHALIISDTEDYYDLKLQISL